MVHKLIYFLETGEYPKIIDHIDGNGLNNKISNLRGSTVRLNTHNMTKHREGKLQGCYFCKDTNKWRSRVRINGKPVDFGRFDSELEAHLISMNELKTRGLL